MNPDENQYFPVSPMACPLLPNDPLAPQFAGSDNAIFMNGLYNSFLQNHGLFPMPQYPSVGESSNTKRKQKRKQKQAQGTNDDTGNKSRRRRRPRKEFKMFGERTSSYRGVSKYKDRYEAFLWDNSDSNKKSKTVYIGGYLEEVAAARAYDLAALKLWGEAAPLNFPISSYELDLAEMESCTKVEYFRNIRRKSKGFSKGVSAYRGVSRSHGNRDSDVIKWQARIGKGKEIKGIYLGTFDSEEKAARAYDIAAIRLKGENAVTNFHISEYDLNEIHQSIQLPIGEGASKLWLKSTVEDIIRKKRYVKGRNSANYQEDDSGSPNPDLLWVSPEYPNSSVQHQHNSDLSNPDMNRYGFQNLDEFQTDPTQIQGFYNSFGNGMSSDDIPSFNFNVEFPFDVNSDGNFTISAPTNLHQDSIFPFIQGYHQNPMFPILHGNQNLVEFPENLTGNGSVNGAENDREFTGYYQSLLLGQDSPKYSNQMEDVTTKNLPQGPIGLQTSPTSVLGNGAENDREFIGYFQSLLQGQDSPEYSNQIEDVTTMNLPQDPIGLQTNPTSVYPARGSYNLEVSCDGIFDVAPGTEEIENASGNGAAMEVEYTIPGNTGNDFEFFEDCEPDLSTIFQTLAELGPLDW